MLIEQQQADETLAGLRKCAEKGEDGYFKKGGVLMHKKGSELGKKLLRVIAPSVRRQQILDLAHKGLAGGGGTSCIIKWWPPFNPILPGQVLGRIPGSIVALALNVKGQADTSSRKFQWLLHL